MYIIIKQKAEVNPIKPPHNPQAQPPFPTSEAMATPRKSHLQNSTKPTPGYKVDEIIYMCTMALINVLNVL